MTTHDLVNHPKHYNSHPSGIEVYEITRHLNFPIGSAFKYVARFDKKWNAVEDLKKAVWYLKAAVKDKQEFPDMAFVCGDYTELKRKLSEYRHQEPDEQVIGLLALFQSVLHTDAMATGEMSAVLPHLIKSLEHMIHALQVSD